MVVRGAAGVGPVGSPAEHDEVGLRQTGRQTPSGAAVVVMVATGVRHPLSSPGRVPR